jgi:predicted metal-dependent hydrolase
VSEAADTLPPELVVRVDRRAKRISLRVDARGQAVLVIPHERFRAEGLRFVGQKREWLDKHLSRQPTPIPFAIGEEIPIGGELHYIQHDLRAADPITIDHGVITVGGPARATARLVQSWLRVEAGRSLQAATAYHAAALGLAAPPVAIRDPKTRWGSCSSRKSLSLSWRLIMAPPEVLDYVAAHEVAHLKELNHSARFWALVAQLCPAYRAQEAWLREHGRDLHRYG